MGGAPVDSGDCELDSHICIAILYFGVSGEIALAVRACLLCWVNIPLFLGVYTL